MRAATPMLLLLCACAATLQIGAAAGYWGADNRPPRAPPSRFVPRGAEAKRGAPRLNSRRGASPRVAVETPKHHSRRVVQGYTDSQGRHYPRLPSALFDYYNSIDGDESNQISRNALPAVPYTRHNRWRHRPAHNNRSEEGHGRGGGGGGRGRGGRRRGHRDPAAAGMAPTGAPAHAANGSGARRHWNAGVYKTSQWGAVRIPHRGASVDVPVLEGSRKAYRGTITTSVVPPPPGRGITLRAVAPSTVTSVQAPSRRVDLFSQEVHDAPAPSTEALPCVRCPGDRAVVANRGRQMVLLEQPELRPCPNGPRFKVTDLQMEWIQGPKPGSLVQEGHHFMLGRVSYKDHVLQTCRMKLNVIVRKCPPLMLPKHMNVQCSLGNSWGSKCQFSCNHGLRVVGHSSAECMDDLSWSHHVPTCEALKGCPAPMSPPHGQLLCQAHLEESHSQVLPENTKCEYVCNSGYEIPATQYHLTPILCQEGAWNSTVDPTCINIGDILQDHPNSIQRETGHKRRRHKLRAGLHKRTHSDPCNPNPCKEGGTCLRGPKSAPAICICPDQREGEFCEHERCREKCENGGKCVIFDEKEVCYCPPGFHGSHCEEKDTR